MFGLIIIAFVINLFLLGFLVFYQQATGNWRFLHSFLIIVLRARFVLGFTIFLNRKRKIGIQPNCVLFQSRNFELVIRFWRIEGWRKRRTGSRFWILKLRNGYNQSLSAFGNVKLNVFFSGILLPLFDGIEHLLIDLANILNFLIFFLNSKA